MSLPKIIQKILNNYGYGTNLIGNDNDVVHKTGDESITGKKVFIDTITQDASGNWPKSDGLNIKSSTISIGTTPTENKYTDIRFLDNRYTPSSESGYRDHVFGSVQCSQRKNNQVDLSMQVRSNLSEVSFATLGVGWDVDNIPFATAPSTSTTRTGGTDIVTRDWIPNDTRIVHTTGIESIYGVKNFHDTSYIIGYDKKLKFLDDTYIKGSSNASYPGILACDKDEIAFAEILYVVENKIPAIQFNMWRVDTSSANYKTSIRYALYTSSNEGYFGPTSAVNNTLNLGQNGGRWKQLFAVNSTISTSDERKKSSITSIPDEVLDVWGSVDFIQYQFNDAVSKKGSLARIHSGLIAQRIDEAFTTHNIDASRYALFCYDEWDGQPEELDENGNIVTPAIEAGNEYSLRYEEALCMEAAYNRRRVSRVEERLLALEQELAELKKNS